MMNSHHLYKPSSHSEQALSSNGGNIFSVKLPFVSQGLPLKAGPSKGNSFQPCYANSIKQPVSLQS